MSGPLFVSCSNTLNCHPSMGLNNNSKQSKAGPSKPNGQISFQKLSRYFQVYAELAEFLETSG